ncbi:MAG: 3-keto-disaccharide hydrolase [Pirellulaceae bacterium]
MSRILLGISASLTLPLLLVTAAMAEDKKEEEGFVSIFDGQSLKGWQGGTGAYEVKDEAIVCLKDGKGGNLYTEKEYANFVFRFEFKLTPGANNGIGIRAPREGDAAFVGMEIQVLDDGHPSYKGLQDYQTHGSVYGVLPAKRGFLKKTGEWNTEEITCDGKHVKVVLNGETIVDGDIEKASTPHTLDKREHLGLKRERGYICFCGHGAHVEFRNLRVKELK